MVRVFCSVMTSTDTGGLIVSQICKVADLFGSSSVGVGINKVSAVCRSSCLRNSTAKYLIFLISLCLTETKEGREKKIFCKSSILAGRVFPLTVSIRMAAKRDLVSL